MSAHLRRGNTEHVDVLVVGGGNSAGYAVKSLRDLNFSGSMAIVSNESVPPYERPALTKAFLHPPGAKVRARLPGFHTCVGTGGDRMTEDWYEQHNVTLLLGSTAEKIDMSSHSVQVKDQDGSHHNIAFEKLILASGSSALTPKDLKFDHAELDNVFVIRNEEDGMKLVSSLESMCKHQKSDNIKVAIVGGGYIGMETAAALSGWGVDTTMVFPEDYLMSRLFPEQISKVFKHHFEERGIKVYPGTLVTGLEPSEKSESVVGGVKLKSGQVLPADVVVCGVGAKLNAGLAQDASLEMADKKVGGVKVNEHFQTSHEGVYAIGDVAAVRGKHRYEHVDFCRKSAQHVAQVIAGKKTEPFEYMPFFYSRLFEYTDAPLVFQFSGDDDTSAGQTVECFGVEQAMAVKGDNKLPLFGALWLAPESRELRGVMLVNSTPEQFSHWQQRVLDRTPIDSTMVHNLMT